MMKLMSKTLVDFELTVMDIAEECGVQTKDDLELFSATLHEQLESAMQNYAEDEEIEDYEPQY